MPNDGHLGINEPHNQVIYYNNDGFPATPDWLSEPMASWACVMGDPDGDGDLDIAFPDHVNNGPARVKMYTNNGGVFGTSPDWQSSNSIESLDAAFCDFDLNGYLDLAVTGIGTKELSELLWQKVKELKGRS